MDGNIIITSIKESFLEGLKKVVNEAAEKYTADFMLKTANDINVNITEYPNQINPMKLNIIISLDKNNFQNS